MKSKNNNLIPKRTVMLFGSFLAILSTFQSCVKDNFQFDKLAEVKWNPNVAVPLIYSSLSIKDMLNNTGGSAYVVEASDKSLTIVYKSKLFSIDASSLVSLPDQSFATSAPVGVAIPPPFNSGSFTVSNTQTLSFMSGGAAGPKIDSLLLKKGSLTFTLNSQLHNSGSIKITIPDAKKNGIAFSKTIPLNYTGSIPVNATAAYDFTGYDLDMTLGGTTYNNFKITYDITLNGSATPPNGSEKININLSMNNLEYSKLFGDIGQLDLSIPSDTIDLSLFTNAAGAGSFTLVNPSVKVTIANSYGVPIDLKIPVFEGYNPGVGYYPITGLPNPFPIKSPNLAQLGQVLVDSFKLNNGNSNIVSIINNTPKQIVYKINASTNPSGGNQNNFILDTSRYQMDVEFELPLYGTAKNFLLVDSIPFTFSSDIPDELVSGLIRTYNSNGFPIDIDLQVYFVDSLYNTLDSLVSPHQILLKSGNVDIATGRVTSATQTIFDATLTTARFNKLKKAKNLIIKGIANTTNLGNTNVKIYSDYKLDFKLGIQAQLNLNVKK